MATVKGWVGGLKEAVHVVQKGNAEQMRHLHAAISEVESACEKDGYDSDCATKDGREPLPLPKDDASRREDAALDGVEDALKAATNAASAIATASRDARSASFSMRSSAGSHSRLEWFPPRPAAESSPTVGSSKAIESSKTIESSMSGTRRSSSTAASRSGAPNAIQPAKKELSI